ncbi:MAG: hypothetical protein ACTHW1_06545 [Ancrocorticia sp.]|uniref:hypothetical protein n=1 Tax=Ancrocorticia sp. TaxID=2593684 RepID=UPI003F8F5DB5
MRRIVLAAPARNTGVGPDISELLLYADLKLRIKRYWALLFLVPAYGRIELGGGFGMLSLGHSRVVREARN